MWTIQPDFYRDIEQFGKGKRLLESISYQFILTNSFEFFDGHAGFADGICRGRG